MHGFGFIVSGWRSEMGVSVCVVSVARARALHEQQRAGAGLGVVRRAIHFRVPMDECS